MYVYTGAVSEHMYRSNCNSNFNLRFGIWIPKSDTCSMQIWLYNVGIHLVHKGESGPYFNIWTENEASRGCLIWLWVVCLCLSGCLVWLWASSRLVVVSSFLTAHQHN